MKGPVSQFMLKHYKHFNAAAMVDAAKAYEAHLEKGDIMMVTLAGRRIRGSQHRCRGDGHVGLPDHQQQVVWKPDEDDRGGRRDG